MYWKRRRYFNPRTPCGVRRRRPRPRRPYTAFQSTHPVRGATQEAKDRANCLALFQSTHPCAGCDPHHAAALTGSRNFNPRTPARGATTKEEMERLLADAISIHAPLRGVRRRCACVGGTPSQISIHAPLRGVRRSGSSSGSSTIGYFNPRTPARGATHHMRHSRDPFVISIHAPLRGVRRDSSAPNFYKRLNFNPRTPARGATRKNTRL